MNEYQIAAISCIGLMAFWLVTYLLSWGIQWAWSWVDDSEIGKRNWIVRKIAHWRGYEDRDTYISSFLYTDKSGDMSDGSNPFFLVAFVTSIIPMTLVLSINFYPVALSVLTLTLIAHVARFSRRHKKIFDEHVKDKSVHK